MSDELRQQLDACKWLYLRELNEPEDNSLRIVLEEAKAGPPQDFEILGKVIKGTQPIESDSTCQLFELAWPTYVAFSVRNETYTTLDESEQWEGKSFRIYSKSHFLAFVANATHASDAYPGPLKHYCLVCLMHLVDVVSDADPQIRLLRPI
jgi:hypothetical protein